MAFNTPFNAPTVAGPSRSMAAYSFLNRKKPTGTPTASYGPEHPMGPSAPANFNYSQVSAPQTASTMNTAVAPTVTASPAGRKLGPSEYAAMRLQRGVGASNFDQYFQRDASGNIYDKGSQPAPMGSAAQTPVVTAPVETSVVPPASTTSTVKPSITDPSFLRKTAESKLTELQKNYTSTLAPSAAEQDAQQRLADFMGAAQMGISEQEGQGRGKTLSLVRGLQGKLSEQANIQAQTLQNDIANYQAARTAAGNVYSAELDFEGKRLQREVDAQNQEQDLQQKMAVAGYTPVDPATVTDPQSIVKVGGQTYLRPTAESKIHEIGNSLVDEQGNVIYTAPSASGDGFSLSPGQTRYDADGNVIAHASETSVSDYDPATGTYTVDAKEAQKLNQQIAASDSYKAITTASNLEGSVDNLRTLIAGLKGSGNRFVGKEAGALASAYNTLMLQAKEFFNLGVLNGPDLEILKDIVPSPNELINLKGGTLPGLDQLETMISDHLKARYEDLVTQYTGYDTNQITNLQNIERKYSENVYGRMLKNGDITEEEYTDLINEAGGTFSNDLSTSQNGSAQQIAAAIRQVESGGNYNARGGSGEGGAYQFMPTTWSQWAKQYLGSANAPMSQENQDKVATMRIQGWLDEGRTPAEIALLWNSGKTTPVKGVNRYGVSYDSGAYRDKVLGALSNV